MVSEFKQFYDNAANAVNAPYKTYVLTSGDINQLRSVATLLDRNHMRMVLRMQKASVAIIILQVRMKATKMKVINLQYLLFSHVVPC